MTKSQKRSKEKAEKMLSEMGNVTPGDQWHNDIYESTIKALESREVVQTEYDDATLYRFHKMSIDLLSGFSGPDLAAKYSKEYGLEYYYVLKLLVPKVKRFLKTQIMQQEEEIKVDLLSKYNYLYQLHMTNREWDKAKLVLDSIARITQTFNMSIKTNVLPITHVNLLEVTDVDAEDVTDDSEENNDDNND